jgi:hypothetical protein
MYRVLWVVAVIAVVALTTSIIGAVVEHSDSAHQASEISDVEHREAVDHDEIDRLSRELHAEQSSHLAQPHAGAGSASVLSATGIMPVPAIGPAALPYSGLTWRHALLLN